jgi:hypothetical protein
MNLEQMEEGSGRKRGWDFGSMVSAIGHGAEICGAELGTMAYGADHAATSAPAHQTVNRWVGTSAPWFTVPRRVTSAP